MKENDFFTADSQDKWTIMDVENLFPQTGLHKAEGKEQDQALGTCMGNSGVPKGKRDGAVATPPVGSGHSSERPLRCHTPAWDGGCPLCRSLVGTQWGSILQTRKLRLNRREGLVQVTLQETRSLIADVS